MMKFSLKKKSVVFVLLIALIVSIASAGISYNIYAKTIDRRYQDNAMDIASTAASLMDADELNILTMGIKR